MPPKRTRQPKAKSRAVKSKMDKGKGKKEKKSKAHKSKKDKGARASKPASKATKTKTKTKAKTKTGHRRSSGKTKVVRARSAYQIYMRECRTEVLERLNKTTVSFEEASGLVARAWSALPSEERLTFEALATLDKSRAGLQGLSVRARQAGPTISGTIQESLKALGKAPAAAGPTGIAGELVEAMEALDTRLPSTVRSTLPAALNARENLASLSHVQRSFGPALAARLSVVLQRWHGKPVSKAAASAGFEARKASGGQLVPRDAGKHATKKLRTESKPKQATSSSRSAPAAGSLAEAGDGGSSAGLDEQIRSKVVGLLMRTVAKCAGQANFVTCKSIEESLFNAFGEEPKEYKRRARSLSFNLGSADGGLLKKVLEGQVPPNELVRLEAEDLAPDALKAKRHEQREKYFRQEVHDAAGPVKRKRDLFRSDRKEPRQRQAQEAEDRPAPEPPQDLAVSTSLVPASTETGSRASRVPMAGSRVKAPSAQVDSDSYSYETDDEYGSSSSYYETESEAESERPGEGQLVARSDVEAPPDPAILAQLEEDLAMAQALEALSPTSSSSSSSSSSSAPSTPVPEPEALQTLLSSSSNSRAQASSSSSATASAAAAASTAAASSAQPTAVALGEEGSDSSSESNSPTAFGPEEIELGVQKLAAMGFEPEFARDALISSGGRVEAAVAALCSQRPAA